MTREEAAKKLHEQTACVHVPPALAKRTLLAAQEKEKPYMKKKLSLAIAFALLAVALCAAALAAANRWGMLDFADRYSGYIPADAQAYVQSDVAVMENDWVTVSVRELYYDGRFSRVTVDVTPKEENTLLMGECVCLEDPFVNLLNNYVEGGNNDMRPVYQVIADEGYERVYSVSVFMKGAVEDMGSGVGDHMLGEDGMLTIYSQEEYLTDMPERDVSISVIVAPFDEPLTMESWANHEKAAVLEMPLTLTAAVNSTDVRAGEIANVYVSEAGADYPSAGVRVDRLMIEVKPQEIYATIDYCVTDREKYDALDPWLWFEFIDPDQPGEGWEQRLAAGLSGGGSSGAVDHEEEPPTRFLQRETLGKNELHDVYFLRVYDASEKGRFETHAFAMRPATQQDIVE